MATIQKRQTKKGNSYRVLIRQKGSNPISKTFDTRMSAQSFIHKVESNPNHLSIITKTDILTYLDVSKEYKIQRYGSLDNVPQSYQCRLRYWDKSLGDREIDDFRFHDLRHTCASYLAQNGASLLEIADVLGHKQIQMTKRYAHLCVSHKQKLIEKLFDRM